MPMSSCRQDFIALSKAVFVSPTEMKDGFCLQSEGPLRCHGGTGGGGVCIGAGRGDAGCLASVSTR